MAPTTKTKTKKPFLRGMDSLRERAFHFLRHNNVAVLATVDAHAKPQVAAVYYAVDADFNIYIPTRRRTRKFRNILKNPDVSFVIGTGPQVVTIQGGGIAEWDPKLENQYVWNFIENFDVDKVSPRWPLRVLPHKDAVVFKIKPQWMVMLDLETASSFDKYEEAFKKII